MSDAAAAQSVIERALERVRHAGADAADCVLVESDVVEARVRDIEIDFVKQAWPRCFRSGTNVCCPVKMPN